MTHRQGGLFRVALGHRKTMVMLGFGFSSGLPYTLIVGTMNAWLAEARVGLATIGLLSWIGLAYGFKFLWSPAVDRVQLPLFAALGRRRSWILLCQIVLALCFGGLATSDPAVALNGFAAIAVIGAFFSATQDIAIDAWRVDAADDAVTVETLSAIYQLGFRASALVGGALALALAAHLGWPAVFAVMGGLMALATIATMSAHDSVLPVKPLKGALAGFAVPSRKLRRTGLIVVGAGWIAAIGALASFMLHALAPVAPGARPVSATDFTRTFGPWIVVGTIILPAAVAALLGRRALLPVDSPAGAGGRAADTLYRALILPLGELVDRLGGGAVIVLGLILSYRLCESIWGPFAYPFYLEYLHYSKEEVAFASKVFGIVVLMIGVALSGVLFSTIGRMPTLLVGAVVTALGNLLFADLASGGGSLDAFAHASRIDALAGIVGSDARMTRLLLAIGGENLCSGLAGGAFVAYLSSITSKQHSAVQYALLSSLTLLIGSLGRAAFGEGIQIHGYAVMFRFAAVLGLVGIAFVLLEWLRTARRARTAEPIPAGADR